MTSYKVTMLVETAFDGTPGDGPGISVAGIFHVGNGEPLLPGLQERAKGYLLTLGFAFRDKNPRGFYVYRHSVTAIEEIK